MSDDEDDDAPHPEAVEVPVEDVLDLHTFAARDVPALVADYLDLAALRGYTEVRIIHGKGAGVQRRIVESIAARHPAVIDTRLAGDDRGSWGATIIRLGRP